MTEDQESPRSTFDPKKFPDMPEEVKRRHELTSEVVWSMNDLPLLARLEFVKNIIFDRGGSRDGSDDPDDMLVIATEVLADAIRLVRKNEKLASPTPN